MKKYNHDIKLLRYLAIRPSNLVVNIVVQNFHKYPFYSPGDIT